MTTTETDRRAALVERYAAGYDAVVAALAGATDADLDARPADGGWTAREVVHHLADSEARSMSRLRQVVAGAEPDIEPYDQDAWAAALPYHLPVDDALAVVQAVRTYALSTVRALDEEQWSRAARHPEHDQPYSVDLWLETYAEHAFEHAAQITAARTATSADP